MPLYWTGTNEKAIILIVIIKVTRKESISYLFRLKAYLGVMEDSSLKHLTQPICDINIQQVSTRAFPRVLNKIIFNKK